MKNFTKRLLLFLFPVILFTGFWEYGLNRMENSYKLKRTQLEAVAPRIKVLVLGPSHALRDVDPEYFSIKGYNAANIHQSLFYDTHIAGKYLDRMISLKIVLIDISYQSLWYQMNTGLESFRDYFYADDWGIKYPAIKWYDIRQYSRILQYGNDKAWSYALNGFNSGLTFGYQENGFATGGRKGPINDSTGYAMVLSNEKEISPENFNDNMNDIITFLKELNKRNIQPVFFIPPSSSAFNKYAYKKRWDSIDSILSSLSSIYHCKFYDFHTDQRFSDSDFNDVTHLNPNGAIKFSKILNEEVLKNCVDTDTQQ